MVRHKFVFSESVAGATARGSAPRSRPRASEYQYSPHGHAEADQRTDAAG